MRMEEKAPGRLHGVCDTNSVVSPVLRAEGLFFYDGTSLVLGVDRWEKEGMFLIGKVRGTVLEVPNWGCGGEPITRRHPGYENVAPI